MKSTSHIWEKFGPGQSIGDPSTLSCGARITRRRYKCRRCGGVVERYRVRSDYLPSPTAKIEADGQSFDCEQYTVYYVQTS